ncbi:hypothetical protein [Streptomyces sp. NPDC001068]|uniref:hypothetical protein n=1 Tax=Streptomyces sp. NPDC001068 TaxID=3364544 RepID=UPI0036BDA4E1
MTSDNPSPSAFGGRLPAGDSGSAAVAMLPTYISALRNTSTGTVTALMTHIAATSLPPHTAGPFADQ